MKNIKNIENSRLNICVYRQLFIKLHHTIGTKVNINNSQMQEKEQIKIQLAQEVAETRARLRYGDVAVISKMINGRYTIGTIRKMFQAEGPGARTMQPVVLEAAKKLVETIDNLQQQSNEKN
jgi:hypothetical protein